MKKLIVALALLPMGMLLGCGDDEAGEVYECAGDRLVDMDGREIESCADEGQVCCCTCPDIETECHCH